MSEKQAPSASSDAQFPGEARGCTVIEVSPSECLDLLQRFGGVQYRDLPSDFRGLVILDVRTAQEYRSGHLKGSINLDLARRVVQMIISPDDMSDPHRSIVHDDRKIVGEKTVTS